MKKLILSELILLFLATTFMTDSLPPGWYQQTLPVNDQINDIYFLDSLTGWVCTAGASSSSDTGYVMKTTNGGNNWTIQFSQIMNLNVIQFVNNNTGYAGGGNGMGRLFKTTDGGTSWVLYHSFGFITVKDLFFVNKDTGWVCDDNPLNGGVFKTIDGGLNWQTELGASYSIKKIFFISKDTGWALSNEVNNKLYVTTNGGMNWNLHYNFPSPGAGDIFFATRDTAWATGGTTGIMKTVNGGSNWFTQTTSTSVTGESKLFFINIKRGFIGTVPNRIIATVDGDNWGYQSTPAFTNFSVYFIDSLKGWAGTNILIHTTDGGGQITYIGIKSSSTFATSFDLKQNYPNPFNPSTTIEFEVQKPSRISLKIYTIDGREAAGLLNYEKFTAGYYYVDFDADDLSSGVYLYQMTGWTEDKREIFIDTKKMVLLK